MKKVIVMGYHNIGCRGFRLLMDREIHVAAVFTHIDNPQERCWFNSLSDLARSYGVPVYYPENPNSVEWISLIQKMAPDVIFSFYYRHMLSQQLLDIPRFGAVNMHGSLLPHYRGRCPVNWQIINGETRGGVTLHYMVRKADAGDIIAQQSVPIGPDDTALDVFQKLEPAAESLLDEYLAGILNGNAPRYPQNIDMGSYCGGRKPEDGKIDWSHSAREIHNLVRAVTTPYPGAFTFHNESKVMIWKTIRREGSPDGQELKPGQVFLWRDEIVVKAGEGVLQPVEISLANQEQSTGVKPAHLLKPGDVLR